MARSFELSLEGTSSRGNWGDQFTHFSTASAALLPRDLEDEERTGDRVVLHELLHAWDSRGQASIGVCDPCEIPLLNEDDRNKLVLVGGLIRRACFWCLGDDSLKGGTWPDGMTVDHLAIHEPGSTGHYIGKDLAGRLHSTKGARPTIYEGRIDLVVDGAIYLREVDKRERVMAVTTSALSAALAKGRGFPLRQPVADLVPLFRDFLTTGVVVHREPLAKDRYFRGRVELFLYGLISATRFLRTWPAPSRDLLGTLCRSPDRFVGERRLDSAYVRGTDILPREALDNVADINAAIAQDCYDIIADTDIYAADCEVSPEEWNNACFGDRKRQTGTWPPLEDHFDDGPLKAAKRRYLTAYPGAPADPDDRDSQIASLDRKLLAQRRGLTLTRLALGLSALLLGWFVVGGAIERLFGSLADHRPVVLACCISILMALVSIRSFALQAQHDDDPLGWRKAFKKYGAESRLGKNFDVTLSSTIFTLLAGTLFLALKNIFAP